MKISWSSKFAHFEDLVGCPVSHFGKTRLNKHTNTYLQSLRQDYEEAAKERDKEMPPFEQVRDDLTKRMSDAFLADYYKDAVKAAKIEWLE